MKFTVFGAGAIGAYLGGKLSLAGNDVTLIARGPHLAAMQKNGLILKENGIELLARPHLAENLNGAGTLGCLILGVKAYAMTEIAPLLGSRLDSETLVIPAQNGIPWWYFDSHGGPLEGTRLDSVDPGGVISASIPSTQIIGCVVFPAVEMVEPGIVQHIEGDRFSLGELDGSISDRVRSVAQTITRAGLRAPVRSNIRQDIWVKLLGNLAFNPISALTKASMERISRDETISEIVRGMMEEGVRVADSLGVKIPISIDQRLLGAQKVGSHKTSMLQDIEVGKPTEIEALLGSVLELGRFKGIHMPYITSIYACVKLLEEIHTENK
jgi:2-dehydropantoate 2-reductase